MSKSARSVFVFSIYLFVLGTILLVIPNVLLNLFSIPENKRGVDSSCRNVSFPFGVLLFSSLKERDNTGFSVDSLCPVISFSILRRFCAT